MRLIDVDKLMQDIRNTITDQSNTIEIVKGEADAD